MKKTIILLMLLCTIITAQAQTMIGNFSIASFNADGLPPALSALGIKVDINPEGPQEKYTAVMGQKIMEKGWDIIGLNEDFNYHDVLTKNISGYQVMTHGGKFESSIVAALGILARTWRFKTDGLGLLVKSPMKASNEKRIAWKDCYGYMDHDNDSLTMKGFRHYEVALNNKVTLDVIVLHADAGGWEPDAKAREKQMEQLMTYVESNITCKHPLIIMGDYNMRYTTQDFQGMVIDRLNASGDMQAKDVTIEYNAAGNNVHEMLDKIIYVNRPSTDIQLQLVSMGNGYDFIREDGTALSDHYPIYASFNVIKNETTGINESITTTSMPRKRIVKGRIVIEHNGERYDVMGRTTL